MRGYYRIAHAAALAAAKVEAAEVPPEAMLIVTVDEGYGDLSCHGNPQLTARHRAETGPSSPARPGQLEPACHATAPLPRSAGRKTSGFAPTADPPVLRPLGEHFAR